MEVQWRHFSLALVRRLLSWRHSVAIESATRRCARRTSPREVVFGNSRHLACEEVFFYGHRCQSSIAVPPRSHTPQCSDWRGDGISANLGPHSAPVPTPASSLDHRAQRASACAHACTRSSSVLLSGRVERKYFSGPAWSAGHSMSSHCSGWSWALPPRTRSAAERPVRRSLLPSRQLMFWKALSGRLCARALTLIGWQVCRGITGGRPVPLSG